MVFRESYTLQGTRKYTLFFPNSSSLTSPGTIPSSESSLRPPSLFTFPSAMALAEAGGKVHQPSGQMETAQASLLSRFLQPRVVFIRLSQEKSPRLPRPHGPSGTTVSRTSLILEALPMSIPGNGAARRTQGPCAPLLTRITPHFRRTNIPGSPWGVAPDRNPPPWLWCSG